LSQVNQIIAILDPAVVIYISYGFVDRSPSLTRAGGRARMPVFALDPRLLPGAIVDMAGVDAASWNAYWAATRNSPSRAVRTEWRLRPRGGPGPGCDTGADQRPRPLVTWRPLSRLTRSNHLVPVLRAEGATNTTETRARQGQAAE
jgi:hypothetical protein